MDRLMKIKNSVIRLAYPESYVNENIDGYTNVQLNIRNASIKRDARAVG